MSLFLLHLKQQLDREQPGWQDHYVCLFDNARYHTSKAFRDTINKLGITVMWIGPYSYDAAPIETVFSLLKRNDTMALAKSIGERSNGVLAMSLDGQPKLAAWASIHITIAAIWLSFVIAASTGRSWCVRPDH